MRTARAAWVLLAFVAMAFAFAARRGRDGKRAVAHGFGDTDPDR